MSETDRRFPASPRRRAEAIDRGHTPASSLLTSAVVLLAAWGYLAAAGPERFDALAHTLRDQWKTPISGQSSHELIVRTQSLLARGLLWLAGLGGVAMAAALAAESIQRGWRMLPTRAACDPSRLAGPGLQQLSSGLHPLRLVAGAVHWFAPAVLTLALLATQEAEIGQLLWASPIELLMRADALIASILVRVSFTLLAMAIVHYLWQRWRWEISLRMTAEEVRQEQRDTARRPESR